MPEYLAPGVYVEEVPSAVRPIAGVGTSTAGFIGSVIGVWMPPRPTAPKDTATQSELKAAREAIDALAAKIAASKAAAVDASTLHAAALTETDEAKKEAGLAAAKTALAKAGTLATDARGLATAAVAAAGKPDTSAGAATTSAETTRDLAQKTLDSTDAAVVAADTAHQRSGNPAIDSALVAARGAQAAAKTAHADAEAAAKAAANAQSKAKEIMTAASAVNDALTKEPGKAAIDNATAAGAEEVKPADIKPETFAAAKDQITAIDELAKKAVQAAVDGVDAAGEAAAAAGQAARYPVAAPANPVFLTSWDQFKNNFGDIQPGNAMLAHAVYGFFNNGGGRCYVARTEHDLGTVAAAEPATSVQAALDAFLLIDDINLVAVPGAVTKELQELVLDHCERFEDRFAILDGQRSGSAQGTTRNSSYGAIYYPWIKVANRDAAQPPSGHVAGVFARVDTQRGVHKAPANEIIRGALGVDVPIGKQAQMTLNPIGVNVIRKFDNNITIWGARTFSRDQPEYVSTRRLLIYLRESIDTSTQWVVFEPNSPELWSKIRLNVNAFLTTVWASGALFGATAEQAFYVRCDETNNPREIRDLGRVVIEIGVSIVKPAEFVIFRISQWAGPGQ